MNNLPFFRGVLLALCLSLLASILFLCFAHLYSNAGVFRGVISSVSLIYIVYLLVYNPIRIGRVTTVTAMIIFMAISAYWAPPVIFYVLLHTAYIWLVRCFYYHNSLLTALADLGLSLLSLATAIWAIEHSHSIFLSFWCFFLCQAVLPLILSRFSAPVNPDHTNRELMSSSNARFKNLYDSADTALRKIGTSR